MDSNESRARALLGDLSAGCSAVAWETADGGHLWGRNFDFNRIAADSKVTFVPRGQTVSAGEKVAEVGSTGNSTGPHLHLELKYAGTHLDPAYYIDYKQAV